MKYIHEHTK